MMPPPVAPTAPPGLGPNPCVGVSCGDNASCGGACKCDDGYDDPNSDGDCTPGCPEDLDAAIATVAEGMKQPCRRTLPPAFQLPYR